MICVNELYTEEAPLRAYLCTTLLTMGPYGKCPCVQIMKSDEDVRMISAEAPVLFAKVRCCMRALQKRTRSLQAPLLWPC